MKWPVDNDIIGTRPPPDLGPLFAQSGVSDGPPTPNEGGVSATRLRNSAVPLTPATDADNTPATAGRAGGRRGGPRSPPESPGSGATNTAAHFGAADTPPVRRAHAPGYPFDSGADAARKVFVKRAVAAIAPHLEARAVHRGHRGVDSIDTRELAVRHGYSTGHEADQRANSWWALVPHAASLVSDGLSDRYTDSGNRPTRYLHPNFAPTPTPTPTPTQGGT